MGNDESANNESTSRAGKYLTFALNEEEYGIGILKVREIIGMMPITPIPRTPAFVSGVINLRGRVIPVIDLRSRFGIDSVSATDRTCIVVVEIRLHGEKLIIGIIVDTVSEVLNIQDDSIKNTPSFGKSIDTSFISGMAKIEGGVKILLDIDRVLSTEDLSSLKKAA